MRNFHFSRIWKTRCSEMCPRPGRVVISVIHQKLENLIKDFRVTRPKKAFLFLLTAQQIKRKWQEKQLRVDAKHIKIINVNDTLNTRVVIALDLSQSLYTCSMWINVWTHKSRQQHKRLICRMKATLLSFHWKFSKKILARLFLFSSLSFK